MKAREVERKIKKVSENKREMEIEEEEERLTAQKLGCYCCCPEETPSRCQDFLKIPRYPKRSTSANRIRTRNEEQLMILYIFERACARTHTHIISLFRAKTILRSWVVSHSFGADWLLCTKPKQRRGDSKWLRNRFGCTKRHKKTDR